MKYTIKDFHREFPNNDVCLQTIFNERYGNIDTCPHCGVIGTKFHRVRKRKCYSCQWCGYALHPLAGTIFHKSSTPLTSWFYAMYLFSVSKNGVSAAELSRHLGVTYKCAFRIAQKIRTLMDDQSPIGGDNTVVEADETYYGPKNNPRGVRSHKAVLGVVERGGRVRTRVIDAPKVNGHDTSHFMYSYVKKDSILYTDESPLYFWTNKVMPHMSINHSKKQWSRGPVHTNTIEGFWGHVKRSIGGTYHYVSGKYLNLYFAEFAFRYSNRHEPVYPMLVERAATRVRLRS